MKKTICILLLSFAFAGFTGCSASVETEKVHDTESQNPKSMFVEVERADIWKIVYDKKTKVMYAVSNFSHSRGIFTLLVDESGNPRIWDGDWSGYEKGWYE